MSNGADYKRSSIEAYVRAQLGDPVVTALVEETDAIQNALNIALTSYWTAFPHTWMTQYSSKSSRHGYRYC
jgi:hypothetical protein